MMPIKKIEKYMLKNGYSRVFGVDEVGMGCLAGPVVVCAVSFDKKFYSMKSVELSEINDSKLLTSRKREELAAKLRENKYIKYKIGYCQPKTIDRLNIHKASKLAMRRAVLGVISKSEALNPKQIQNLKSKTRNRAIALVDGVHKISGLRIEQKTIIKGDRKVFVIACASILAKVFRDEMMTTYAKKYPSYGFEIHKGYGTKKHYARLASAGPCVIHRKSFRLD